MILTPNDPEFYKILHSTPPPGWRNGIKGDFRGCFAVRADSLLLQPLSEAEAREYIYGGEFDELAYLDDADSNC